MAGASPVNAIAAGIDPTALLEPINEAQAQRRSAEETLAMLTSAAKVRTISRADVEEELADVAGLFAALDADAPEALADLYEALAREVRYDHRSSLAEVRAQVPYAVRDHRRVANNRVRGGTHLLTTRLQIGTSAA